MSFSRGGATILIAEDDASYGEALSDLMRREGHAVHLVTDGQEAINTIRRMGERIDLLLCDLLLPLKTGFDVIKEIVDLDLSVPVLAMTGVYDNLREVQALRGLGVAGYLHKSAPFEHLLFRVNNLLFPCLDNQRGNYRVAVAIPAQFKADEQVCYGTTYNLSESGVYIRTSEALQPGSVVEVALGLPTARAMVQVKGEVMHSASPREVRGTAYPAGFGARFFDVPGHSVVAIRAFVEVIHRAETQGEDLGTPKFTVVEVEEPVPA